MRRGPKPAKSKEAKPSVARKTPKNDGARVRDLEQRLADALAQQKATADILRIISGAPTDVQPVLDALIESVTRLCGADTGVISQFDGQVLRPLFHSGASAEVRAFWQENPFHPGRGSVTGRVAIERRTLHVPDVLADSGYELGQAQKVTGYRTVLVAPMLRGETFIGVVGVWRTQVRPFTEHQVKLVEVFADQAVIAIENVRMFKELEARNRDLTASAEILQVISRSPTDLQPVFDTIVRNAANVCGAFDATLALAAGDDFVTPAHHGPIPRPPIGGVSMRGTVTGRAIREARTVHVADLLATEDFPVGRDLARAIGYRTVLVVPLLREGAAIGAIGIRRTEVRPFTDTEMALLQTFADQAVIAIENVRLFTEVESRNRDLTATSDILQVIASSPTDAQPVFDAIARNAVALCGGITALVLRFDGEMLRVAGHHAMSPEGVELNERAFPRRPGREYPSGRAFLDRSVVHIPDLQAASEFATSSARQRGVGSLLVVPLLQEWEALGVIGMARREVGPFSPRQIEMLQTFAAQAVIAIENVRLVRDLRETY